MMTKIDAIHSRRGQYLYHATQRNADHSPTRVVVVGKCKTWKGNDNFRLPVKSGNYNGFDITPSNAHQWSMIAPKVAQLVA